MPMPPVEVFLSHASEDRAMADALAKLLVGYGIPTFYSPHSIVGAQQWQDEILGALKRCDWFVVLLSPAAINSMWVKRECAFALNDRRYEGRIIPLNYLPCELNSLEWLTLFQMVDFSGDLVAGSRQLLRCWEMEWKQEPEAPGS